MNRFDKPGVLDYDKDMDISTFFPVWDKLSDSDQARLRDSAVDRRIEAGELEPAGADGCVGLVLIRSAVLRVYIISEEGREITLFRLGAGEICLFSAYCMFKGMEYVIHISAQRDGEVTVIPASVYHGVIERSAALSNFTSQLMAQRFSDVVWLIEQILWKSFDARLAAFLLEESDLEDSDSLRITHETIADHLGTAREVVTRMLRYFQREGYVSLSRGRIELQDKESLCQIADR